MVMKNGKTVDKCGTQNWHKDGKLHRTDGPAILWVSGSQAWYKDDKCHRLDGPAIILANGSQSWYINGKKLSEQEILDHKESMEFDKMMRTALEG